MYPEVDFTVAHTAVQPLIGRLLGGWEHARMIEFNFRVGPTHRCLLAVGETVIMLVSPLHLC